MTCICHPRLRRRLCSGTSKESKVIHRKMNIVNFGKEMFAGPSRDYRGTEKTSIKGVLPGSSLSNTPSSYFLSQSLSRVQLFATLWTTAHQYACPSPTPGVCSNSCPLRQWCHPTISSSVTSISFCPQSCLASGSFPTSWLFSLGGQSIGPTTSVLPMNIQDWFILGLISLISLQSKRLSRVFSSTTVQKHQFSGTQLSLWSNFYIHTWLLEKP